MRPEDFDFPQGRITSGPPIKNCRLMVVDRKHRTIMHSEMQYLEYFLLGDEIWGNNSYNDKNKDMRFHPVYAKYPGSHATPTAGIHITSEQVKNLQIKTLTLHIGNPREQDDILKGYQTNIGWKESYYIPKVPLIDGITAIGTTVVKAFETLARTGKTWGESELFIQAPFEFKIVKKLLTNFHFAKEPLLALTCAFGGYALIREAYEVAVQENYGFSDYGDRLLIM